MIKLIPQPYRYAIEAGAFNMHKGFTISYPDVWQNEVDNFMEYVNKKELKVSQDSLNSIDIIISPKLSREGYLINVGNNNITISASTDAGCFYALTSLKQLMSAYNCIIPCFQIDDRPRYNYRGFMLDVARYFYSVDKVKEILDIIALHKFNFFHMHLTDDQGWRLEIKKYPALTDKGSRRSHTNFNLTEHKGYYTQEDIKEIVEYAHSLHIKVIPEIDMPGHMQAALHAYPELGCFDRKLPVATHFGIKHDILCGGKSLVRRFVKDVIDEVVELFPDKFIHIGGDEAVKTRWELCPKCQAAIKNLNLKNENELQVNFINDINAYIKSKGYTTIMWNEDEITGKVSRDIIWMIWNITDDKRHLINNELKMGRIIINASSDYNYLDLPYSKINLTKAYSQDTQFVEENKRMIGMEAPLWTEFVPNIKKAWYMMFPRLGAIAEASWSEEQNRDIVAFDKKMDCYYDFLTEHGVTHIPTIKNANPNFFKRLGANIWWERRKLCWHGLHNLVDNLRVKHMVKKKYPEMLNKKTK